MVIDTNVSYDEYVKSYLDNGHSISGIGTYSKIFIKDEDRVNKIGILDDEYFNRGNLAYVDFINRVLSLEYNNIYFPIIYNISIFNNNGNKYFDIELEYLLPVTNPNIVYLFESLIEYDNAILSVLNNNKVSDLMDAIKILKVLFIKYDLDLSITNIMKRSSGQIVISDPIK